MATEYRPCVVAVFTNSDGKVLVCERSDTAGAWQLPQGGIEPGESALNALYREMREEIGCDQFKIIKEAPGEIKYRFPADLKSSITKKWVGQAQVWFLTKFDPGCGPDMSKADGEFVGYDWRDPKQVLLEIIEWKHESYEEGLRKLNLI